MRFRRIGFGNLSIIDLEGGGGRRNISVVHGFFCCEFHSNNIHLVVNFLSQVIFVFVLLLGMVMYANEVETKEI